MTSRRVSGGGVCAIGVLLWLSACGSPSPNLFSPGGGESNQPAASAGQAAGGGAGKSAGTAGHGNSAAGAGSTVGAGGDPVAAGGADPTGGGNAVGGNGTGGDPVVIGGSAGMVTDAGGNGGMGGSLAGNGGMGGAPPPPPKPVGSKCSKDDECELGFCTDGVCCESACHAACKACSSAGKCNLVPIDDDACGNIACPTDTACRDYPNNINTNRCASFGVCKTSSACTFTSKAARTSCSQSGPDLCDGQGNCVVPSVNCGGATCPVNNSVCCGSGPSTFSCVAKASGAGAGLECLPTGGAITCDENGDCPTGQQCCITAGPTGFKYACAASGTCPQTSEISHSYPICKSLSLSQNTSCAQGTSCQLDSAASPSSFLVCKQTVPPTP